MTIARAESEAGIGEDMAGPAQEHIHQLRYIRFGVVALLCLSLAFSALTVNFQALTSPKSNRYWRVIELWTEQGISSTFGLWIQGGSRKLFQINDDSTPVQILYSHSSTGFLLPIYLVERLVTLARGRPSGVLLQLYSQIVVLLGAIALSFLAIRIARRRQAEPIFAGTVGLAAGLIWQNFFHNLAFASEIYPSTVSSALIIFVLLLRDKLDGAPTTARRRIHGLIAVTMFWMALSDMVPAGFLPLSVGLLSFYGVGPVLTRRTWLLVYVFPVVVGFLVLSGQVWLAQRYSAIPLMGTPLVTRMGLQGLGRWGLGGHWQILSNLRETWRWPGFAALALVGLIVTLIEYRDRGSAANALDLSHVASPLLIYIFVAAVFSQAVLIHPYIYDLFVIIPSVLLVVVYLPLHARRWYPNTGAIALGTLMFAMVYVWVSLVDYAIFVNR
jgi:hypothetical protein